MSKHFEDYKKRKQQEYIEETKRKFDESLKPLTNQLMQVIGGAEFEDHVLAIKALLKRCKHCYNDLLDESKAEERERIAIEEGDKWVKGLAACALEQIRSINPLFNKTFER